MLRGAGLPAVNPRLWAVEFLAQIDGSLVQALLGYGRVQIQLVAGGTAFEAAIRVGLEVHGEDAAVLETGSMHRTGTAKLRTTDLRWDKFNEPQDLGDGDHGAKIAIINTRHSDKLPSTFDARHRTREEEPVLCLRGNAGPVRPATLSWASLEGDPSSSGFFFGTNNHCLLTRCFSLPAGVNQLAYHEPPPLPQATLQGSELPFWEPAGVRAL
jgi:hypothetical protein